MTPNFFCTSNTNNYVITSAIPLFTILFGARAYVINQTQFPVLVQTEMTNLTLPKSPVTTCSAAYFECENGHLCLEFWSITNRCHPGYTNVKIIEKCQNFEGADFINDTALFIPVTNTKKNITYINVYCGICNFEKDLSEFESWTPWLFFANNNNELLFISSEFKCPVGNTEMLNKLKVDDKNDLDLIAALNETIHKCDALLVVPDHLKNYVELCNTKSFPSLDYRCDATLAVCVWVSRNLNQNYSDPHGLEFCLMGDSSMESYCDYRDQYGDICSINEFVSNDTDTCGEDGYILWKSSEDEDILAQCSNYTSNEGFFYVCGPSKSGLYEKIKNRVFNILDHTSTFFLSLYLVLGIRTQNLKSLPKHIFYSYSVTLFAYYVLQFPLKYAKSCVMKYYLFFYTWQSHSFWILITSFDLWRLVYNSSKFQKVNVERQTKRYVLYCMLGWGLPALFLAALFPTLTQDQKSWSCHSVLGFENEMVCSSSCDFNKYTFNFGWVTIAIFLLLTPAFLILTGVFVFLSTRNTARSNVNRYYTTVLLKVSIMMGLHWTLLVYLTLFDYEKKFSTLYRFMSSFHGCFIFFAFGFKENLDSFKRLRPICKSDTE